MYHELIFSYEPYFRFNTESLRMLGFLMCSHRTDNSARDSLWGMMNPYIRKKVARETIQEFMVRLVEMATKIPADYYKLMDEVRDEKLVSFL